MSDPIILKTPAARLDLASHLGYIGERSPETARRFRINAEATFATLARHPGLGEPQEIDNSRLEGIRCFRVNGFRNYVIFHSPLENGIDVIRVLHAARDMQAILSEDES